MYTHMYIHVGRPVARRALARPRRLRPGGTREFPEPGLSFSFICLVVSFFLFFYCLVLYSREFPEPGLFEIFPFTITWNDILTITGVSNIAVV